MMWLLIAAAGGVGAVSRFLLDGLVQQRSGARFPVGTLAINVLGSLLLGWLASSPLVSAPVLAVLGTGFCGGFTTFSTASVEAVRLAARPRAAVGYAALTLVACALSAALGAWIGRAS